jgi:trans-aconitate methyltransferase
MTNKKNADRWDAEHYDKNSAAQFEGALEILNDYAFKGNETILDIGCGHGKLTAEIATHVPHGTVLGIDSSENMIQFCQKMYNNISNASFQCIPAEEFFTEQKFDLIVSFFTFHWIENQMKVFENAYQMLKPGGILVIKTAGGNSESINEVFEREHWKNIIFSSDDTWHAKTADDYKEMLEQSGYQDIKATTEYASRFFQNTDAFIGYAMAWVPHVTGLSHEQSLQFSRELAENAQSKMQIKDPQGRIELTSPLATVWAQKPSN